MIRRCPTLSIDVHCLPSIHRIQVIIIKKSNNIKNYIVCWLLWSNAVQHFPSLHRIYEIIKKKLKSVFCIDYRDPTSSNDVHWYIVYKKLEKGNYILFIQRYQSTCNDVQQYPTMPSDIQLMSFNVHWYIEYKKL